MKDIKYKDAVIKYDEQNDNYHIYRNGVEQVVSTLKYAYEKIDYKIKREQSIKRRTCTQCGKVVETFSEIKYSQGDRVCKKCKEDNKEIDNRAYDNWATNRNLYQ